ncbi:ribonuclease P protein component [Ammonifex thiophilus]|uniref:Ribonuclease P protein component n=1 Tax=Ammonifex thiophilus TaxID=444093 RepID=A0A3D8P5F3_9THEO|nr:ribonuclease P protein component [Ammonifex thiophilus]RDV84573.1 ribonuclease P protein component [Ammonifex thiophilus]
MRHKRKVLSRSDFSAVFSEGRRAVGRRVVVYFRPNELDFYRLGFAVSKKVRTAVKKNRVRRLLREVCRLNPELFRPGFDYVLLGREGAEEASYWEIEADVREALRRGGPQ